MGFLNLQTLIINCVPYIDHSLAGIITKIGGITKKATITLHSMLKEAI